MPSDRGLSWVIHTCDEGANAHLEVKLCHPGVPGLATVKISVEGALLLASDLLRHAAGASADRRDAA